MTTVRIVGGGSETELTLEGPVEIGRLGADVEIADEELSRRHLRLTPGDDGTVVLEDLESSNGTWIDGARVSGARTLEATTVVLAGQSRITVEIAVAAADDGRTVFQTTPPELPDDGTKVSQTIPEAATQLHAEPEPQVESPTVVSTPAPVASAPPPPPPAAAAPPPPPPPPPPAAAPPPPPPPAAAAPPPPPPPPAAAPPPPPAPAPARSAAPAPSPAAGGLAAFGAYRPASRERRTGVASRQLAPAALVFLIIAATAAALVIYFASR